MDSEVEVFRRGVGGWEPSSGSGGGGWFDPPFRRPDSPPDYAALGHFHASGSDDWRCCAAFGVAGTNGSVVEVVDGNGVTRLPIESPLGVFVVSANGAEPAVARVLDPNGAVLMERRFSPEASW